MRDEHKPKQDLIHEVVGLRKQVEDLKRAAIERRRVEDALRASEEQYRVLIEQAPAGICRLDREGRFVTLNGAFAAMLGYASRAEALEFARIDGLFVDAPERERVMHLLASAAATGIEHVRLRRRNGGVATMHLHARIADIAQAQHYIAIVEPADR